MATTPRVAAASGPGASPSIRGWGGSGGASQQHSVGQYDGEGFATSFGVQPGWRPTYDDRHGQGYFFFGQYPRKEEAEKQPFTPVMAMFAASFPALTPVNDVRSAEPVFISDLVRGVGIYDFNLKAIAGTLKPQGAVLNRYG
jgi:hypothetical protein